MRFCCYYSLFLIVFKFNTIIPLSLSFLYPIPGIFLGIEGAVIEIFIFSIILKFLIMLLLVLFKSTDRFRFHNLSLETMMKTVLWEVNLFRFYQSVDSTRLPEISYSSILCPSSFSICCFSVFGLIPDESAWNLIFSRHPLKAFVAILPIQSGI